MINTKMTLVGKIAICLVFFFAGLALGYKTGIKQIPSQQTNIEIKDLKTKKGGTINLDTKTNQDQENKEDDTKKKKGFFGIF